MILYYHPSALLHDAGPGHPEAAVRIEHVLQALEMAPPKGLERREPPAAELADIMRVHPEAHVKAVLGAVPREGYASLDGDTTLSPGSREASLHAAGAVCAGVDAVLSSETKRAFCLVRPPGHHAEPERAMGFCIFNSIAIGAMRARHQHQLGKIAIVDFDVHHGNGTQAAFWDDPDILYVSIHQSPLYPGTGAASERGSHDNILNCPMPPGTGSREWRTTIGSQVLPVLQSFAPEMVLISAGFDAHASDPLANFRLVEEDFGWITGELVTLAEQLAEGRVVSVLEGGYNPPALARSVMAHLDALNDVT